MLNKSLATCLLLSLTATACHSNRKGPALPAETTPLPELSFAPAAGYSLNMETYASIKGAVLVNGVSLYGDKVFSCSGCPEGMVFDENLGTLLWIPDETQAGATTFTVSYLDNQNRQVQLPITVQVSVANQEKATTLLVFPGQDQGVMFGSSTLELGSTKCLSQGKAVACPALRVDVLDDDRNFVLMNSQAEEEADYLAVRLKGEFMQFPWTYRLVYIQQETPDQGMTLGFSKNRQGPAGTAQTIIATCHGGLAEVQTEASFTGELQAVKFGTPGVSRNDAEIYTAATYTIKPSSAGEYPLTLSCRKGNTVIQHKVVYTAQ